MSEEDRIQRLEERVVALEETVRELAGTRGSREAGKQGSREAGGGEQPSL